MFKLDKMSLCSNVCIYTIIKLENVRVYAHRETSMFKLDEMSLCSNVRISIHTEKRHTQQNSNVCIYTIIKLENVRVYAHIETSMFKLDEMSLCSNTEKRHTQQNSNVCIYTIIIKLENIRVDASPQCSFINIRLHTGYVFMAVG